MLTAAVAVAVVATGTATAPEAEELVDYEVVDYSIPEPLTDEPGDPERGRAVAINRQLGNCLSCHAMPIPEQPFHGETGPALTGVGDRLDEGQLRLQVVNAHALNPQSMMPAFYEVRGKHRVAEPFEGKPILTAQQVEDVVAYLKTLKE
ncbi:sulfur oxidation c-type cytochrome SoxX [Phormidium willei BDU 130791]|nr:sulfur oxidation c-type cytochrome SoxX [Phormidium willei BDU 130791]